MRTEHPRMFLTSEDIPQIQQTAATYGAATFNTFKKRIDKLIGKEIVFENELAKTGESTKNHNYGYRAAEAAMLWLITHEQKYLDFAKSMVCRTTDYYRLRVEHNLNIHWYAFTQIATLCAYDWIYNDLGIEERERIGSELYNAIYGVAWHGSGIRKKRYRENISGYQSGLYGASVLPWYIGITFYNDGIDDKECVNMLCKGYDLHQKTLEYRAELLGKNGGCTSGTVGYGLGAYPYAEYNFFYTFRSATGIDLTPQMGYMLGYLRYMDWIRLPGNREFGIGDSHHNNNKLPKEITPHIKEIANLFGACHPEILPFASNLLARYDNKNRQPGHMTFTPLLHRYDLDSDSNTEYVNRKSSYHFEQLGQIIMRSGINDDDTYAAFSTERTANTHQHFDINNFIIYKHGFRALDSGTRPYPGLHLSHYYARTVAHNCITIRMPGEKMPKYWGGAAPNENRKTPVPNDGGQCSNQKGKLLAYEEGFNHVYIASDATECYHEAKAELVLREFIWIKPDIFVIYDRVVSDKAEYPKRWLYHTAAEPRMRGKAEFEETSQGGKSICRTLLPKGAVIERVGGEGKQFWSDGKNWSLPDKLFTGKTFVSSDNPLLGQWRVEVSPQKEATHDHFLHIIQVGNKSLSALPKTKVKENNDSVTLTFKYDSRSYRLIFDKTNKFGCKISY